MLPPDPPVVMFPTVAFPTTFNVPAILAPVPVTTIVVVPLALILTLPLDTGILTLLVPLLIPAELIAIQLNPPDPFVCSTYPLEPPVIVTLPTAPKLLVPDTVKLVNVPTDVIFGCAAVVNVPVNKLAPIVPELAYIFAAVMFAVNVPAAEPILPTLALPETVRLVNVPVLVMLGCAAVVSVPVSVFALKLLTPVILPPEPPPKLRLPVIFT